MPAHEEFENLVAAMTAAEPQPADGEDEENTTNLWSITYKTFRN